MEQHDELLQMFRNAKVPEINDLLNLLDKAKNTPKLSVKNIGGYGEYNWSTNELTLSPRGGSTNTVAHELTHALDNTMNRHRHSLEKTEKLTDSERKFVDAYSKLKPETSKLPLPKDNYRGSPAEMRAFGVGNMVDKGDANKTLGYKVSPHLDATMATDAAVLRELYNRVVSDPNSTPLEKLKYILTSQ